MEIAEKFNSGRVKDLKIILRSNDGSKEIHLYGNEIRSKLRTPAKNLMLWSTLFEINESGNKIIINPRDRPLEAIIFSTPCCYAATEKPQNKI